MTSDAFNYSWNVLDTSSTLSMIRLTDGTGAIGKSGIFTIKSSNVNSGTIVVLTPASGEVIAGGMKNYQITWTGTGITSKKTLDYSLDSGKTWTVIGSITSDVFTYNWSVPDTISTKAIVRVTDNNNLSKN